MNFSEMTSGISRNPVYVESRENVVLDQDFLLPLNIDLRIFRELAGDAKIVKIVRNLGTPTATPLHYRVTGKMSFADLSALREMLGLKN